MGHPAVPLSRKDDPVTPVEVWRRGVNGMDERKDVRSEISGGLQHLTSINGIKGILKIQLHKCMICRHIRQKPPNSIDSSFSSSSFPNAQLFGTQKGSHLISNQCACDLRNQTMQRTSHSNGPDSSRLLARSHQRHTKKTKAWPLLERPHGAPYYRSPSEHSKKVNHPVSMPRTSSFRCCGLNFSRPPSDPLWKQNLLFCENENGKFWNIITQRLYTDHAKVVIITHTCRCCYNPDIVIINKSECYFHSLKLY